MNFRTFFALICIILIAGMATAAYATFQHSAFKIGDGKWLDLNGQGIGSSTGIGYAENITCIGNCQGFGGSGGNASYPIDLSNSSQATRIFSANTSNLTVTYLSNGNVSLNALAIKGDTGNTGAAGAAGTNGTNFTLAVYGQANITGDAYLVAGANITLTQSGKNITITSTGSGSGVLTKQNFTIKAINTVYQNTNATAKIISIATYTGTSGGNSFCWIGDANPPTQKTCEVQYPIAGAGSTSTFVVLPNHYYLINQTGVTGLTIRSWVESE